MDKTNNRIFQTFDWEGNEFPIQVTNPRSPKSPDFGVLLYQLFTKFATN
jgi:hypothetical protein